MIIPIIAGIVSSIGTIVAKKLLDNRKASNSNKTKVELEEVKLKNIDQKQLLEQNKSMTNEIKNLEDEVSELRSTIDSLVASLNMFFMLVKDELKDKPHIIRSLESLQNNLKKK